MYNATVIAGDQDKQKMLDEVMAAIDEVLRPKKTAEDPKECNDLFKEESSIF